MGRSLGDTAYSRIPDSRFKSALMIGRVSSIECTATGANVRVIFPDRVDHKGQPLITKPIPVLQPAATKKKSFSVPRIGTNVLVAKLPNGTGDYHVLGSFYTTSDPPPVTDPNLDHTEYDDGSVMQFDAGNGTLTWNLKGGIVFECQGNITIKSDGGNVTIQGTSLINLIAMLVKIQGNAEIDGNLVVNGNVSNTGSMTTGGIHTDANGVHS